ncbi:MAG: cytochrome o ubiquinol oxidase subunit III [Candidatus Microsaccharimonas sp.]
MSHRVDHAVERQKVKTLGFWVYLMTDCVLFATLFATYAVLQKATAGGPSGAELFDLPFILVETMLLLTSSFTVGLGVLAAARGHKTQALWWLAVTFLLGIGFIAMELYEFHHLIAESFGPQRSAFLSAYFVLVGTHGLHILIGLIWMSVMIVRLWRFNLKNQDVERLGLLGLFWHFLDIIWIFIFTIVYLMGSLS